MNCNRTPQEVSDLSAALTLLDHQHRRGIVYAVACRTLGVACELVKAGRPAEASVRAVQGLSVARRLGGAS